MSCLTARRRTASPRLSEISARIVRASLIATVSVSAVIACSRDEQPLPTSSGGPEAETPPTASAKRWSDPANWPDQKVPTTGADVVIPKDLDLVLDVSPPPLASLKIEGTLTADERDLEITAGAVHVFGKLVVGSESAPFAHKMVFTLTGDDPGTDQPSKMIAVYGLGALELHGESRTAWTRLAATATAGSTQLLLDGPTDWRAGDRVVVASTSFEPNDAEVVRIASVAGPSVSLVEPLRATHWGSTQLIGGATVDERAEVGLLSRNIVVRGDERSDVNGFGGHIIVMGGTSRVEGVELTRVGQRGKLARYPIHWHMMGDAPGQYARGNSIWHSFSRCVTVHGTNDVTVANNVCYDHAGHGYFLEDGVEARNTFSGNLGVMTRIPPAGKRLLASDATPATFWMTNPDNTWRNNVAAGSEGFGFWLALPEHPTGLSTNGGVWPQYQPLREFAGNVSHSNRINGLHADDGPAPDGTTRTTFYTPRRNRDDATTSVPAELRDFVAYKNVVRGAWLRGTGMVMKGGVLADNRIGATFAASNTYLRNALVVGESDNHSPHPNPNYPVHGFEFYDGPVGAEHVTFVNFQPNAARDAGALGLEYQNWAIMNPANGVSDVQFVNARAVTFPTDLRGDGERMSIINDRDGSLTGIAGAAVTVNNPLLIDGSCQMRSEWNASVCASQFAGINVQAFSSWDPLITPFNIARDDGKATPTMEGYSQRWVALNVPTRRTYTVRYPSRAALGIRIAYEHLSDGEWVRVTLPYTYGKFVMHREGDNFVAINPVGTLAELDGVSRTTYVYDAVQQLVHIKLVAKPGQPIGAVWLETRD
ncbi:MAG TPA: G8 domain-containing protein [Gemmatimonadaceae bacterium]|nr:G8 domain-containing protein [Gemmatimonadaceae bacterium]